MLEARYVHPLYHKVMPPSDRQRRFHDGLKTAVGKVRRADPILEYSQI
jgi:hypothetical protein